MSGEKSKSSSLSSAAVAGSSSSSSAGSRRGVARVLAKLDKSLQDKKYYEAHQMYHTLYFRYVAQNNYGECENLLYEGSVKFFEFGEEGSGSDLAKLYLETLEKAGKAFLESESETERIFPRLTRLYSFIPLDHPDKNWFISASLKWSGNHPRLHQLFAHSLWSTGRYPESRHHFLRSSDGTGCGSMLAEFHLRRGFPREIDLFVVGTVLQYLCLRKHVAAARALQSYADKHPSITKKAPPYAHPLLNFVWLLLVAIETKQSISAYSILIEKYKSSLKRDPSFLEYLDKIGQTFFGLPPPRRTAPSSGGGMFSGLFDSLLNVLNEPDDDDPQESTSSQQQRSLTTNASSSSSPVKKMETEDLD